MGSRVEIRVGLRLSPFLRSSTSRTVKRSLLDSLFTMMI
jgi:hypothetical protein